VRKRIAFRIGVLEERVSAEVPDGLLAEKSSDALYACVPQEDPSVPVNGEKAHRNGLENQAKKIRVERGRHRARGNPRGVGSTFEAAKWKVNVR